MACEWTDKIFSVAGQDFEALALEIFHYQYDHNDLYRRFAETLEVNRKEVDSIVKIPFLPIHFFKTHKVICGNFEPEVIFESSGTTRSGNSRHLVKDAGMYEKSFCEGFHLNYGNPEEWCILALLPSYLERKNSSLVYMAEKLIKLSGHPHSGFYLNEFDSLAEVLKEVESDRQKTLLLGVTFALLDFSEEKSLSLNNTVIMETGGMKGRRKELTRQEVHDKLKKAFGVHHIHSEYGMTELLSQAYSKGDGKFSSPPWMKILIRDEEDPLHLRYENGAAGSINIIDLANVHSCSFVATEDVGRIHADGSFEVLGRMDGSDLRGCSLMTV